MALVQVDGIGKKGLPLGVVQCDAAGGHGQKEEIGRHGIFPQRGHRAQAEVGTPHDQKQPHGHRAAAAGAVGQNPAGDHQQHRRQIGNGGDQADLGIRGAEVGGVQVVADAVEGDGVLEQQPLEPEQQKQPALRIRQGILNGRAKGKRAESLHEHASEKRDWF